MVNLSGSPGFRIIALFLVSLLIILTPVVSAAPRAALAQGGIQVTEDRVTANFPESLRFRLAASSDQPIEKVFLLYGSEGRSCQQGGARQELEFEPAAEIKLSWELDFTRSGTIPPGAQIWWQWEITAADGSVLLTERQTARLQDQRHEWRTLSREGVNVQWYQGSEAYGAQILDIARRSLARLEEDAGLSLEGDVWLTIYPDSAALRQTQKASAEWTGGLAYANYNVILLAVGINEMAWAQEAIPHEMAHLVTGAAVFNCYGTWLPTWLEEGLAGYASGGPSEEDLAMIKAADEEGVLPPLKSMERGFSAYTGEAGLAYAQSYAVVAYLLKKYDPHRMTELIAYVREGSNIEGALWRAYFLDTAALDYDWRAANGFKKLPKVWATATPEVTATLFPTLALWTSAVRLSPTLTVTETPLPPPSQTPRATPSLTPEATPEAASAAPGGEDAPEISRPWWLGFAVALLAAVAVIIAVYLRRKIT